MRYVHLNFIKQGIFLAKSSLYEILKSGDQTFDLWDFKVGF